MNIEEIKSKLRNYDGPPLSIMEVCGSHTAAIQKTGIPSLLSDKIRLLHGPGCPVCVSVSAYVDRLIALAKMEHTCVVTFGDMLRIPGSASSLLQEKAAGARVEMVYSPLDTVALAERDSDTTFVFAAVGFETTAPTYALLVEEVLEKKLSNVKLLTALKTMPPVIRFLCEQGADVQGFLSPGHVSVVTGSDIFRPLAEAFGIPFVVAGFQGPELLTAFDTLISHQGEGGVFNCYPSVVTAEGNLRAQALIDHYFTPGTASWRGLGEIEGSGLYLKEELDFLDAGSRGLNEDTKRHAACRCGEILSGRAEPSDCPLFGVACTPTDPKGACMVSEEGACAAFYAL